MTAPLDPGSQSASQLIADQLAQWGLGSLTGRLNQIIRSGNTDVTSIVLQLKQSSEWQQRFAGNAARIKKGLSELSPAEYIATENSYRQVMQSYGLPASFWDQPSDYQKLIENDVSPDEVKQRASDAQTSWLQADPQTRSVWRDFYGLTDGAAIAAILDPDRATSVVHQMAQTAQAGGAARQQGLEADQGRITGYIDQGFSVDDLRKGFGEIAGAHDTDQSIAARFGTTFDQASEEQSRILGLASANRKQESLYDSERALFAGRASADQTSLQRRTGGAY